MALKDPAADVRGLLNGQTLASVALVEGTNLFSGRARSTDEVAAPSVHLLNSGGGAPVPYLGGAREAYWTPSVQVMVRGAVEDFAAGEALARAVLSYLAQLVPTGYVALFVRESQPTPIGLDDASRPMWSINLELQYKAAAG